MATLPRLRALSAPLVHVAKVSIKPPPLSRSYHHLPETHYQKEFVHHYLKNCTSFERQSDKDVEVRVRDHRVYIQFEKAKEQIQLLSTILLFNPSLPRKTTSEFTLAYLLGQDRAIQLLALTSLFNICHLETPEMRGPHSGAFGIPRYDDWVLAHSSTEDSLREAGIFR